MPKKNSVQQATKLGLKIIKLSNGKIIVGIIVEFMISG